MSQQEPPSATPDPPGRVVRRPRYVPFLATGAAAGALATAIAVLGFGSNVDDTRTLALYLGVLLCGLGALLGGAVAVWLERQR